MKDVELFRKIPLFRGLDDKDLLRLAAIATESAFVPGQVIFGEGSSGDAMFIVKSGTVRVFKQSQEGEEEIARFSGGQHFGEMALIDNETRSATVDTVEASQLIRVGRDDLEKLLAQDDALSNRVYRAFTKYLCNRLRQTTNDLAFIRGVAKRLGGQEQQPF